MSWITINSQNEGPGGRWGHSSIALDEKLYIFGGFDGNYLNDFYSYDFDNNLWQTIVQNGQVPEPRSNHIMFINNGTIYIQGGGGSSKTRFGDLYSYNKNTWIKQKINLIPRTYHTACVGDNKLFIFGGESGRDLDDLEIVDLFNNTQYTVKVECMKKPEPRRFATLHYHNNQLILIGGCRVLIQNNFQESYYKQSELIYYIVSHNKKKHIILYYKNLVILLVKTLSLSSHFNFSLQNSTFLITSFFIMSIPK